MKLTTAEKRERVKTIITALIDAELCFSVRTFTLSNNPKIAIADVIEIASRTHADAVRMMFPKFFTTSLDADPAKRISVARFELE